jgi:uncharacterized membrane protein
VAGDAMISFLETIVKLFTELVTYIAAGAVTVLNLVFDGLSVAGTAIIEALPELPVLTEHITPKLLAEANWFFPFGGVAAMLTTMLTAFILWMAVRYFLRLVRAA